MKIDLSRFKIDKLHCQVNEKPDTQAVQIWVRAIVKNVTTGQPTDVNSFTQISRQNLEYGPKDLLRQEIRRTVLQALEHEIDECLFIDGVRLNDPHPIGPGTMVRMPDGTTGSVAAVRTLDSGYQAKVGKSWFSETELVAL